MLHFAELSLFLFFMRLIPLNCISTSCLLNCILSSQSHYYHCESRNKKENYFFNEFFTYMKQGKKRVITKVDYDLSL